MFTKKHRLNGNERTEQVFIPMNNLPEYLYKALILSLFSLKTETLGLRREVNRNGRTAYRCVSKQ